ncbi:MAG: sugar phosphate isomerase/epimerase [Firmicutes bacterium]|nr:sugar phosphate isomerase/epimerase [Bacillota bacterium]
MNIGIRLHDLDGQGLEEKLIRARELGFTCVHLALSKVVPDFSMQDARLRLTRAYAKTVRGLLTRHGLQAAVLGCYLNLATPDEAELKITTECYLSHLRFAAWIGAKVVGTETGAPAKAHGEAPERFPEDSLKLFIERLWPVVKAAEEVNVPLAIEPVCRHIVHTPQSAKAVLEAFRSPQCKIILDPVNLLNAGNAASQEEIFTEALALLGKDIEVIHWKDYQAAGGEFKTVAAGMGEMKGESILRFAAAHEHMPITLENTDPSNASRVRAALAVQLSGLAETR